jgi:hypothetical protein
MDMLGLRSGDRVGMVGYFEPLVARIESQGASLTIFERSRGWTAGVQPAERAVEVLPSCTVALITSTTLITGTLDELIRAAARCREVALLGPSTPLIPEAFTGTGVTWLSGIVITDPRELLRVVSEGGGTREFSPYARKVNLHIPQREPREARTSLKEPGGAAGPGRPAVGTEPGHDHWAAL